MVTRSSQDNLQQPEAVESGHTREFHETRSHRWLWWLLPIVLLSGVAAYWGVRHIEKQVVAAAPIILRDAGVDPAGLNFQTDYRNITVTGQLPEGVSVADVRKILEQKRGAAGEDIRHATVVADEWVKPEPPTTLTGDAKETEGEVVNDALIATQIDTLPRVNLLLGAGTLTLSGSDVSRAQVDRLLEAASSSVGSASVRQQWQAAQLPGSQDDSMKSLVLNTQNSQQIEPLARLVGLLGDHATAASITLENGLISGSIEARSEQSMELLKTSTGDGVVVTATVASEQPVVVTPIDVAKNTLPMVAVPGQGESVETEPLEADADNSTAESARVVDDSTSRGDDASGDNTSSDRIDSDASAEDTGTDSTGTGNDEALRTEISALQREIDALQQQIQENVFFVHDSSAVTRQAQPILHRVGDAMRQYRRPSVMISGHTDSLSDRNYNLQLSERRAAAVVRFLTQNGIDSKRLRSQGFGEDLPVSSNKTLPGRRLNRRVEFTARKSFAGAE